jgi:hypothetical protein
MLTTSARDDAVDAIKSMALTGNDSARTQLIVEIFQIAADRQLSNLTENNVVDLFESFSSKTNRPLLWTMGVAMSTCESSYCNGANRLLPSAVEKAKNGDSSLLNAIDFGIRRNKCQIVSFTDADLVVIREYCHPLYEYILKNNHE